MLLALLPLTLARGPFLAIGAGGAIGGGEDHGVGFTTFGPALTAQAGWHTWFLEEWIGLSSTALLDSHGGHTWLAAPFQAEFGLGVGSERWGFGAFNGYGVNGALVGLYAHVQFEERWGVESRLFGAGNVLAFSMMARMEIGPARPKAPPPPPPPHPPVYHNY
jgi:hypothetical protein